MSSYTLSEEQIKIQQKITKYGVDNGFSYGMIDIALNVALIESSYLPNASNPKSTASGLFQYLDGSWNTYHSSLGDKNDVNNQIEAFYKELNLYSSWYNDPKLNGNIAEGITFEQYVYIKHHDGRGYADINGIVGENAPGYKLYTSVAVQDKISQTFADNSETTFSFIGSTATSWFSENTNGALPFDGRGNLDEEAGGGLILNSGILESDFNAFLGGIASTINVINSYMTLLASKGISIPKDLENQVAKLEKFVEVAWVAFYDPLVLDLDGDGIETLSPEESHANFDLFTEEGYQTQHGWISKDDGLLALDKNSNGTIDDISELFGNRNLNGFDDLSSYDDNFDNVIDSSDIIFEQLLVWQDKNEDGISSENELHNLSELGIVSISLDAIEQTQMDNDNIVADSSTFLLDTGETRIISDVYFGATFSV